jgi:hypothetical protein
LSLAHLTVVAGGDVGGAPAVVVVLREERLQAEDMTQGERVDRLYTSSSSLAVQ